MAALAFVAVLATRADPAAGALDCVWERLAESLDPALEALDGVRALAPGAVVPPRIAARCATRIRAAIAACVRGERPRPMGCAAAFGRAARMLSAISGRLPGAPFAAVGEAAGSVAHLLARARRDPGCARSDPSGVVPAYGSVLVDGRSIRLAPACPLASGRRYRLLARLRAGVSATEPPLASGWLTAGIPPAAPEDAPAAFAPFLERLRRGVADTSGLTVRPAIVVVLDAPLSPRDLLAARPRFVPEPDPSVSASAVPVLRIGTVDARLTLDVAPLAAGEVAPAPEATRRPVDGAEAAALGLAPGTLPHVEALFVGRFASLDLGRAIRVEVPFLLTLPAGRPGPAPVVILLNGLGGTGAQMLVAHAGALAEAGLSAATFDLPLHGARQEAGVAFLVPADPPTLVRNLRQAALDTVALSHALRTGAALSADAAALIDRRAPRLMGYSLGAITAALALGVDRSFGTTVLMAPAGDLTDWLAVPLAAAIGQPVRRCAGWGPAGQPCRTKADCPPHAHCVTDPAMVRLFQPIETAYRTALADADPQTYGSRAPGTDRRRPILLQEGARDAIIVPFNTEVLAATMGADPTCRLGPDAPQVLCRFPDLGHELADRDEPRRQAYRFLATDGHELAPYDGLSAR